MWRTYKFLLTVLTWTFELLFLLYFCKIKPFFSPKRTHTLKQNLNESQFTDVSMTHCDAHFDALPYFDRSAQPGISKVHGKHMNSQMNARTNKGFISCSAQTHSQISSSPGSRSSTIHVVNCVLSVYGDCTWFTFLWSWTTVCSRAATCKSSSEKSNL